MTKCSGKRHYPCSLFVVKKDEERSETKVNEGPEGFDYFKGEKYTIKYSFRAEEGMRVSSKYTHLGQLKGTIGKGKVKGTMIKLDPIFCLTANKDGLMVRFSNREMPDNFHEGLSKHLNWKDSTGQWVHVKIVTTFGESMVVRLSGAVEGRAVWPSNLKPVAWHRDADRVRMKLGLYHKTNQVYDGKVEYRDISIEGPNGIIRTSPESDHAGHLYIGCFADDDDDHVFSGKKYVDAHMTNEMCADLCDGTRYFGTQDGTECWCSSSKDKPRKYGKSTSCNRACPGTSRIKTCGGRRSLSVFKYEAEPEDVPRGSKYMGCFADDVHNRALTLKDTKSSKMDYDTCKRFCDAANARYFGLQSGTGCFCGKWRDDYDEHGPAVCSTECAGDSKSVCGGSLAQTVFRI
ncbi:unnamed protein product [Ectocarpus fasciculatus]